VVLGILALLAPVIVSLAATVFFGWILLLSGIMGLITTFRARQAPGFWWSLPDEPRRCRAGADPRQSGECRRQQFCHGDNCDHWTRPWHASARTHQTGRRGQWCGCCHRLKTRHQQPHPARTSGRNGSGGGGSSLLSADSTLWHDPCAAGAVLRRGWRAHSV